VKEEIKQEPLTQVVPENSCQNWDDGDGTFCKQPWCNSTTTLYHMHTLSHGLSILLLPELLHTGPCMQNRTSLLGAH